MTTKKVPPSIQSLLDKSESEQEFVEGSLQLLTSNPYVFDQFLYDLIYSKIESHFTTQGSATAPAILPSTNIRELFKTENIRHELSVLQEELDLYFPMPRHPLSRLLIFWGAIMIPTFFLVYNFVKFISTNPEILFLFGNPAYVQILIWLLFSLVLVIVFIRPNYFNEKLLKTYSLDGIIKEVVALNQVFFEAANYDRTIKELSVLYHQKKDL